MENRVGSARGSLAEVLGLPVVDSAGVVLGSVVGRVISGTTIDLLVRRRRLFARSRYLRLQGDAITMSGSTLVYDPAPAIDLMMNLEVLRGGAGHHSKGDAA